MENNTTIVPMKSAAKREARLKAAAALEEASSDKGNSSRMNRRMSAAAAISTTPFSSKSSTSEAVADRMNRRIRLQKSNSKRLGGRSGSSRKLAVDDDYSDGEAEPARESKRGARMRAASKLSEMEEVKSTNSGRARRSSGKQELASSLTSDSHSRRTRLQKSGSMRGLQRGSSSRGLGSRGNSSHKLRVDSDEEEEVVEEETFKSKPSSRPRIPRRTTSMEDFHNTAVTSTESNRRRPLQRHKSADGSSMPFKRGQRRPSMALADRSASVRRGLGGPGGGGLSRGNSQRRFNNIMNDALEDIDNSNDENPRSSTSRRRRDGTSPPKDSSNQDSSSLRRGPRRALSSDNASIGNSTNNSVRRTRRGSGMVDDSSNRRRGIGRSMSGMEDSSSGRRGVSRNSSGGTMDDSSAVNGKGGGSRRRDGGMRHSGSGGALDESSNADNNTSRRRGVARNASGIGGNDAMRRRQTQRFVEKVSSMDDDDDEHGEGGDNFDVAPQDGVLHGRGLGDGTRRRREPTLSRMSINDLRSRLQGTTEEEEAKAAKARTMGEGSQGENDASEGDIWSTDNASAPLQSNLND